MAQDGASNLELAKNLLDGGRADSDGIIAYAVVSLAQMLERFSMKWMPRSAVTALLRCSRPAKTVKEGTEAEND